MPQSRQGFLKAIGTESYPQRKPGGKGGNLRASQLREQQEHTNQREKMNKNLYLLLPYTF
jgi:hypothetical protein